MSGGISPEKREKQELVASLTNPSCHSEQPAPCSGAPGPGSSLSVMLIRVSLQAVTHSILAFPSHPMTVQLLGCSHPCSHAQNHGTIRAGKDLRCPSFPFPCHGFEIFARSLSSRAWVPSLQGRCEVALHVQLLDRSLGTACVPQRTEGGTGQGWDTPTAVADLGTPKV